jgi:hypothetical protein
MMGKDSAAWWGERGKRDAETRGEDDIERRETCLRQAKRGRQVCHIPHTTTANVVDKPCMESYKKKH